MFGLLDYLKLAVGAVVGGFLVYLQATPFDRNAWLVAASRIFPVLDEPRVETNRDRFLELVLFKSKIVPPRLISSVSDSQAKRAMDLYAQLLLSRASRMQINAHANGELTLQDVGLEAEMRELLTIACEDPIAALPSASRQLSIAGVN
ncbi:hypothetical protein [Rhizobium sp. LEGMi135b]